MQDAFRAFYATAEPELERLLLEHPELVGNHAAASARCGCCSPCSADRRRPEHVVRGLRAILCELPKTECWSWRHRHARHGELAAASSTTASALAGTAASKAVAPTEIGGKPWLPEPLANGRAAHRLYYKANVPGILDRSAGLGLLEAFHSGHASLRAVAEQKLNRSHGLRSMRCASAPCRGTLVCSSRATDIMAAFGGVTAHRMPPVQPARCDSRLRRVRQKESDASVSAVLTLVEGRP